MEEYFRAHRAVGTTIPTFFIESTAPNNVDDFDVAAPPARPQLQPIDSQQAIQEIAQVLATQPNPNLVVMVHGFNNPEPDVFKTYAAAASAIEADKAILKRGGLVCMGYRWPSEKMGDPRKGTWDALPTLPTWILYVGGVVVVLTILATILTRQPWWLVTLLGAALAGLVLTAALLRTIVYFRDNYRASNYGIPDLIQIIRSIDGQITKRRGSSAKQNNVQLSFIGHSMGGFVVTNAIRTLSDLFQTPVDEVNDYGARGDKGDPSKDIGKAFRLTRFILASPDVPAETLMSSRGNFLASALRRFDEAYLFSNEGDAVLRQISTLANYFVFPTKSSRHGFRLGNVEVLSRKFGMIDVPPDQFLSTLRIGYYTLQELYDILEKADEARRKAASAPPSPPTDEILLPKRFTYFDCTDYRDRDRDGKERALLSFAKCQKRDYQNARLRWYSHLYLLFAYLAFHQRPNVHGGYFEGELAQKLIFRLACLGFDETVKSFGGEGALSKLCADKQIRALISPRLTARRNTESVPTAPTTRRVTAELDTVGPAAAGPAAALTIPNVVGMPIEQARAAIEAVRASYTAAAPGRDGKPLVLLLEVATQSTEPRGTVLNQTPPPGTPVKADTSIELAVAKP